MARYAHQSTGSKNLVMAGGVALNSVANGRIVRETPFEGVYIQPAAGDAGCALGAALYVYHVLLGKPRKFVMEHAYWGAEYSEGEMQAAISASDFAYDTIDDDEALIDRVVGRLVNGKVVAWYRGRFEWGPRALGHRSILADPRSSAMKEIVNTKIKFREPFRPFAPVVLEERASEYFNLDAPGTEYLPRFMLMVTHIPEDKQDQIQAVTSAVQAGCSLCAASGTLRTIASLRNSVRRPACPCCSTLPSIYAANLSSTRRRMPSVPSPGPTSTRW